MADPLPEDRTAKELPPDPDDQPTLITTRREDVVSPSPTPEDRQPLTADLSLELPASADDARLPLERLGDYELILEIARGGMGVVFQARHVFLHRMVALKMILGGQLARPEDVQRFQTEAEAAAQLQHPGIVALYEVGTHEGQPFFSMEFVQGTSLAQVAAAGPVPSRTAARYLELTARAVHYAHTKDILHRDLKPANVLLDEHDQPKVTDFGLAKMLHTDSGQTRTGTVIGTPSYMAPEQAAARRDLGPECDVYSLGAILYELLTGRPPFRGETALATLTLLAEQEPVPPRLLNPKVDLDLETICLKCLEKEPARRYRSAEALADDLRRYRDSEPITARRVGSFGRAVKWCRRKPAGAALLAVSAVAVLALVVGGFAFGVIQSELRQEAEREHLEAVKAQQQAQARAQAMRRLLYLAQFHLARHAWVTADLDRAEKLLARDQPDQRDLRGWEWYFLSGLCRGKYTLRGPVKPGGLKNPRLESRRVNALAYRPDGRRLASAGLDGNILIWDPDDGRLIHTIVAHKELIWSLAYSPDGNFLASASVDRTAKVWNARTGQIIHTLARHTQAVTSVSFSSDGKRLATAGVDGAVHLWNLDTGSLIKTLTGHTGPVNKAVFSPDGKLLASAGEDAEVRLWDAAEGELLTALKGHQAEVMSLAFSQDGKILASGGGLANTLGEVRLWNTETRKEMLPRYAHPDRVLSVAFSRYDHLAVAGRGGLVRVWDRTRGSEAFSFQGDTEIVNCLAFNPGGRILAAAGKMGTIRLWNTREGQGVVRLGRREGRLEAVAFSPDSHLLAAAGGRSGLGAEILVWDARTASKLFVLTGPTDRVRCLAFDPRSRFLYAGGDGKEILVYDLKNRKKVGLIKHPGEILALAVSPDGATLASASSEVLEGRKVYLWDAATGRSKGILRGHTDGVLAVAFSPDGQHLASGSYDKTVRVWDLAGGKEVFQLTGHDGWTCAVAFSPRGNYLASASTDKTVRVWNLEKRRSIVLEGATGNLTTVVYSPEGDRIVAGGHDQRIHMWDVITMQEILTLTGPGGPIASVAMSRDQRRLACADRVTGVHLWEAEAARK
jgi:WD40 repeat protein